MKLTQCAKWSQFNGDYFFSVIQPKLKKNYSPSKRNYTHVSSRSPKTLEFGYY